MEMKQMPGLSDGERELNSVLEDIRNMMNDSIYKNAGMKPDDVRLEHEDKYFLYIKDKRVASFANKWDAAFGLRDIAAVLDTISEIKES